MTPDYQCITKVAVASSRPGHCQCHAGVAGYGNQLSDLLILRFEVAYETVSFFCGRIEDTDDTINFQDDILTLSMTAQTKHRSTAKQTAIMQYVNPSSDSYALLSVFVKNGTIMGFRCTIYTENTEQAIQFINLLLKENLWKKRNKNRDADITNGEQYLYEERPCPMYLIPKKAMTVGIMVMMK